MMNDTGNLLIATIVALLMFAGYGIGVITAPSCEDEALALAESSIDVTDDLADYTATSLERILMGIQPNFDAMDGIADRHWDNKDELEDLLESC